MQQTLRVLHATDAESIEHDSYRLRDIVVIWYIKWEKSWGPLAPLVGWRELSKAFLQQYFPIELRRANQDRFLRLEQGNMSGREYNMQFNSLAKYAPLVVAEMGDRVHPFVGGLGPHLINECTTSSMSPNMDIARIQAYAQSLVDRKRQQRAVREHDRGQHNRARSIGDMGES
ncbi:uncharacterized protein [Nicotiana tomentosiformis]|uniref:uncharacterized protein n=1 Tax=Nicotiana tomentosiformis TaxID=4098 RepID=UPI00388C46CD